VQDTSSHEWHLEKGAIITADSKISQPESQPESKPVTAAEQKSSASQVPAQKKLAPTCPDSKNAAAVMCSSIKTYWQIVIAKYYREVEAEKATEEKLKQTLEKHAAIDVKPVETLLPCLR
jgi:hypothetical protein